MSNSYTTNPIVLDTFSADISISAGNTNRPYQAMVLYSIEWVIPTSASHTATVYDIHGATKLFDEQCVTPNQSIIKYFGDGLPIPGIVVTASTATHMTSGKLRFTLK